MFALTLCELVKHLTLCGVSLTSSFFLSFFLCSMALLGGQEAQELLSFASLSLATTLQLTSFPMHPLA